MPQNRRVRLPRAGDIVRSVSGRDRYRIFLVTELDGQNRVAPVVIADGKKHPLAERKHKNPRHLKIIAHCGEYDENTAPEELDDVRVYEICGKYDISGKKSENPIDKSGLKNL